MVMLGFLSGSVMYSYIIPKFIKHIDVRTQSADGNPGSSNARAASGAIIGFACLFFDIAKAAIPVYIAVSIVQITGAGLALAIAAPVLGHAFSPFLAFKGGKAVAASYGALLGACAISWAVVVLIIVMAFFRFIFIIKPDSAKVITAFLLSGLFIWGLEPLFEIKIAMLLISIVVCGKHLLNPNEGKLRISIGPFEVVGQEKRV